MSNHHETHTAQASDTKTITSYTIGFVLCCILTLLAFGLVEAKVMSEASLYVSLAALAITQLFVQCICFLRLNCSSHGLWNLLPFIFSIFIIVILVGGSLWIMYNLNYNMM